MRGFTIASVIVLVVVVGVIGAAAVLLARTVQEAQSINDKAQNIATTGRGINTATDSVIQLTRTNNLARSILKSANPLETQLGGIVATAQGIDGLAGSINSTAGSINSTAGSINDSAGRINTSAGSINSSAGAINSSAGSINASVGSINDSANRIDSLAASILSTAVKVHADVRLINTNLDVTLSLVSAVKGDTGNILAQAGGANDTAACIDRKLFGQAGDDGDCQGQPTPAAANQRSQSLSQSELGSTKNLKQFLSDTPPPAAPPSPGSPAPPAPAPGQPALPLPVPELPQTPAGPLDDVIDGLLPGLRQGRPKVPRPEVPRPEVPPPGDLLDQLFPGLGLR